LHNQKIDNILDTLPFYNGQGQEDPQKKGTDLKKTFETCVVGI
jgi:hypothetical protein